MTVLTNTDVAAKVRGIAAERRVSRAEMAEALNVSLMSMSRRMNGVTPFTAEELIKLAQLCERPVSEFFGERAA